MHSIGIIDTNRANNRDGVVRVLRAVMATTLHHDMPLSFDRSVASNCFTEE
jgi:hypothetical protein